MKNISIGKILDTTNAHCDFCKEEELKKCVESEITTFIPKTLIFPKATFFGAPSMPRIDDMVKEKKTKIHICYDCIRQLSKLTRQSL